MSLIKQRLKRNKCIYNLNGKYKEMKMKREIKQIDRLYSNLVSEEILNITESDVKEFTIGKIENRIGEIKRKNKGKLRIFWVGTNLEQDKSGFLQDLEEFGEVTYFCNSEGTYGLEGSNKVYDENIIERNNVSLLNQVRKSCKNGRIDILIGQMLATRVSENTLKQIQNMGVITVNIAMDDRLPELWKSHKGILRGSIGLARGLDLVLNTSPECCNRYIYHGCPAIYWPLASSSKVFKPNSRKDIDVSFIGSRYGIRERIVNSLTKRGIKVSTFGPGWENGPVTAQEAAKIFGRSKIILGIGTIGYATDIYTLKLRDFDATMAGSLYITHRNPDLASIFHEGKEIEYYLNEKEAAEKVEYYLKNENIRSEIAENAYTKATKSHSWEQRFNKLFSFLNLI